MIALTRWNSPHFEGGDNATYIVLSETLETPRDFMDAPHQPPYRRAWEPDASRDLMVPMGYPVMLYMLGIHSFEGAKRLSFVCYVLALVFLYLWSGSWAVTATVGLCPVAIHYASIELSDMPFLMVAMAGVLAIRRRWLWLALFISACAAAFRPAGLILFLALGIELVRVRRWGLLAGTVVLLLLSLAPMLERGDNTYINPYNKAAGRATISTTARTIWANSKSYCAFAAHQVIPF